MYMTKYFVIFTIGLSAGAMVGAGTVENEQKQLIDSERLSTARNELLDRTNLACDRALLSCIAFQQRIIMAFESFEKMCIR